MQVTEMPQLLSSVPNEEAMTPLPTPEITPPVTRMYFILELIFEFRWGSRSLYSRLRYLIVFLFLKPITVFLAICCNNIQFVSHSVYFLNIFFNVVSNHVLLLFWLLFAPRKYR